MANHKLPSKITSQEPSKGEGTNYVVAKAVGAIIGADVNDVSKIEAVQHGLCVSVTGFMGIDGEDFKNFLKNVNNTITENITKLASTVKSVKNDKKPDEETNLLKVTIEGTEGLTELNDNIFKLSENLKTLNNVTVNQNLNEITVYVDKLKELFEKHVIETGIVAGNAEKSIQTIKLSSRDINDIIVENARLEENDLENSEKNFYKTILAITLAGVVLLIAAAVIEKFPNIEKNVIRFTVCLVGFLLGVMLPIQLAARISSTNSLSDFENIAELVLVSSICMMIGGLFIAKGHWMHALIFGGVLSAFITAILLPTMLLLKINKNIDDASTALDEISSFIIKAALVMTIGALFILIDKYPAYALKFGVILTLFVSLTILPFVVFRSLAKAAANTIEEIGNFIVKAILVMSLGAMFISFPRYAENTLKFGLVLNLFTALVILPFATFGLLLVFAAKQMDALGDMVIKCAIVMTVGALFMLIPNLFNKALQFALAVHIFLWGLVVPIVALALTGQLFLSIFVIKKINRLIRDIAVILIVGTLFMTMQNGLLAKAAIKFALLSVLFIWTILAGVVIAARFLQSAQEAVKKLVLFIGVVALLLLIGSYFMQDEKLWKGALAFITGVTIFALAIIGIAWLLNKNEKTLTKSIVDSLPKLCLAIALLSSAILLTSIAVKVLNTITANDLVKLGVVIAGIIGVIYLLTIKGLSEKIEEGTINALLLSTGIAALSLSIMVVVGACKLLSKIDWEDLGKFTAVVVVMATVFGIIGIAPVALAVGVGSAVAVAMGLGLVSLSIAISIFVGATKIVSKLSEDNFDKTIDVVKKIAIIFGIIGIPPIAIMVGIGSAVAAAMSAGLVLLSAGLIAAAAAVRAANEIYDIDKAVENIKKIFTLFDALPGPLKVAKYTALAALSIPLIFGLSSAILMAATAVQTVANLSIVEEWDANGKPTKFRHLTEPDFTNAAENVGKIILTLGNSIIDLYNNPEAKQMFEATGTGLFKRSTNTPFGLVVASCKGLGEMISSIAQGIAMYANMNVIDDWDENGNPTKYRHLDEKDFTDASKHIGVIISLLARTITDFINSDDNEDIVKLMTDASNGLFGIGKHDSTFSIVLGSAIQIGEMLKNMSEGIGAFANLTIPQYDKDGKVIGKIPMNDTDFTNAQKNIAKVLICVSEAIISAWQDPSKLGIKTVWKSPLKYIATNSDIVESINEVMQVIGGVVTSTKGVIDTLNKEFKSEGIDQEAYNNFTQSLNAIITCGDLLTANAKDKDALTILVNALNDFEKAVNDDMHTVALLAATKKLNTVVKQISKSLNITSESFTNVNSETMLRCASLINSFGSVVEKITVLFEPVKINKFGKRVEFNGSELIKHSAELYKVVGLLVKSTSLAQDVKPDGFRILTDGVISFITDINTADLDISQIKDIAEQVDKYVKSVDNINVAKLDKLSNFIDKLDNLSKHVGSLDKLVSVLADKLSSTLAELANRIEGASKIIKESDRIQQQRHKLINESIEKIKETMSQSLKVEVKAVDEILEASEE